MPTSLIQNHKDKLDCPAAKKTPEVKTVVVGGVTYTRINPGPYKVPHYELKHGL